MIPDDDITHFAKTNFRNHEQVFGIRRSDRRSHMYIVGKTGTGKSTLFHQLISEDIANGEGLALLDPHGDLSVQVLTGIPSRRQSDVIFFDVPNPDQLFRFNPLTRVDPIKRPLVAASLMDVFKKLWPDAWGVRLEHLLRNTLLALLDQPAATLADILRMFDNPEFRKQAIANITNEQVRRFWLREYPSYPVRFRAEMASPIQNKVGAFLADPLLHRILCADGEAIQPREIMDEGKILLVNLAKGKIGEDASALMGSLLISQIGSAGLSRADTPETGRRDFYVYLDEFQTFTTLSLASMLSELRKYRINLVLANQYLAQIDDQVEHAVFGNAGTLIAFRVGPKDAEFLAKEFSPEFTAHDLMNLPNYHVYVRLMINGATSRPFSARTIKFPGHRQSRSRSARRA